MEDTTASNLNCQDGNGSWPRSASEVVPQLTDAEWENLKGNSGLDGSGNDNCPDLKQMLCDMKQDVEAIAQQRSMVIAANDVSKCGNDDDPTLASMWSRILRYSEAVAAVLCGYDPFVATILKSGRFPQVLAGAVQEGGYPQWITPDDMPTANSKKPVTSGGVYQAVRDALLGVWHVWDEYPEFGYFAQSLNDEADSKNLEAQTTATPPETGDTALVRYDGTDYNVLYTYGESGWAKTKVLTEAEDGLRNYTVTHINKGSYAENGVYYFDEGDNGSGSTWQVMDASLGDLEAKIEQLEELYGRAVVAETPEESMILATRPTLADAQAVPCTSGKTTIILITG